MMTVGELRAALAGFDDNDVLTVAVFDEVAAGCNQGPCSPLIGCLSGPEERRKAFEELRAVSEAAAPDGWGRYWPVAILDTVPHQLRDRAEGGAR